MTIKHRNGRYSVQFTTSEAVLAQLPEPNFVITDRTVFSLYGGLLSPNSPVYQCTPGEASKTPTTYLDAVHWLAQAGAQRDATVIAVGGGVVGDLAGFVAASYMRGVPYVQVPTTLLAQVDSSVGGKVGVDLPEGKNMLGAFHPPVEVRIATELLNSLSQREFANGLAEVLKYGFIMAPEILEMDPRADLKSLVQRCIECKRDVVEADEFEATGRRAILNFGHTVGHALERATGYRDLLHGEAISIGMVAEASLSERLSLAPPGTRDAVDRALSNQGLPTSHPLLQDPLALTALMRRDKKASGGKLAFSLLRGIGVCELVADVPEAEVISAIRQ